MVIVWVKNLRECLPKEALEIIKHYENNRRIPSRYFDTSAFTMLVRLGIFRQHGNSYYFLFEYFSRFLKQHFKDQPVCRCSPVVEKKNGQLFLSGTTAQTILSPQEHCVFELLYNKRGKITSYDDIARLLWPDDEDAFSLWAIHKLMSRIRRKLKRNGMYTPAVVSLWRKGYTMK